MTSQRSLANTPIGQNVLLLTDDLIVIIYRRDVMYRTKKMLLHWVTTIYSQ